MGSGPGAGRIPLAAAALACLLLPTTVTSAQPLAIVGGTIIDGNGGRPVDNGVILIEGKRILAVGGPSLSVPPEAQRIQATGKYIMPGIMDANVHLFYYIVPTTMIRYEGRYEEIIAEAAQISLASGVTTVFDTFGPREALTHVRDRINGGELVGSRVFLAGNIIGFGGPTSTDFFPISRQVLSKADADSIDARWEQGTGHELLWLTPAELRVRIRRYIESGHVDFLKYAASGHMEEQFLTFSAEASHVIVEEAHRAGLTVQAHTTSPASLNMEIQAGVDLLQHCDITGPVAMPADTLGVIAEHRLPCAALLTTRRFLAWDAAHGPEMFRIEDRSRDDNDRRLIAAGAILLLTTDGGVLPEEAAGSPIFGAFVGADDAPTHLGLGHFRWLQAASELGMKPMDALLAATRNVARAYKVDKDLGTLEKGKYADLLILDKNPLESPENYRSITLVMKEGRVIDTNALPNPRVLTTALKAPANGT